MIAGAVKLEVGAVRLQAACDDEAIDEARIVIDDNVGKRRKHRRSALRSDKVALLVGCGLAPRALHRPWSGCEAHGASAFEYNERAPAIVGLRAVGKKVELAVGGR